MAAYITIGRQQHHLERSGRTFVFCLVFAVATLVSGCSKKQSAVPSELAAYVPAGTKVTETFDRKTDNGRNAMIQVLLPGPTEDYVTAFKTRARSDGFTEQVDQTTATGRVIAYRATGDRTLTLQITTAPSGSTAAVVLSSP
jgi:hypothetical protein